MKLTVQLKEENTKSKLQQEKYTKQLNINVMGSIPARESLVFSDLLAEKQPSLQNVSRDR